MSRLLRLGIGRESLFLIFRLFIAISSHLCAHFAYQKLPFPVAFSLSCFPNYSSFAALIITGEAIRVLQRPFQTNLFFSELKMRFTFCNPTPSKEVSRCLEIIKLAFLAPKADF